MLAGAEGARLLGGVWTALARRRGEGRVVLRGEAGLGAGNRLQRPNLVHAAEQAQAQELHLLRRAER